MTDVSGHFRKVMQEQAGATYCKADLHVHTPSSEDARWPSRYDFSQDEAREDAHRDDPRQNYREARKIACRILDQLVAEGIKVAAFTDHNTPGYVDNGDTRSHTWYDLVKEERKRRGKDHPDILLLPGVEITTDGIHVLGIFDDRDEFATFKIAYLLRSVGIRESEFGEVDVFGTKSIWEVADAIDELGGICIPAHANKENMRSLLSQFEPPAMEIKRVVQHHAIHVLGVVPPDSSSWREDRAYQSILGNKRFRDTSYHEWMVEQRSKVPQHLPALGYVMNSDAHAVAEIGRRYSWIKMDDLSFRSLASALRDPAYRIWPCRRRPSSTVRSHILGISVEGGFADGLCLRFNEHFNCIVAGPNTGKTTLMRVIHDTFWRKRLGLRIRDDLKAAFEGIVAGLWDELKGDGNPLTRAGMPHKRLPEAVRPNLQERFLETRGLPWSIYCFFSRTEDDGRKVVCAAERRRIGGIDDLDGNEDQFRYYRSEPLPADLDQEGEVRFREIEHREFRRMFHQPRFFFEPIRLGDRRDSFAGARELLNQIVVPKTISQSDTWYTLSRLCDRLEAMAEGDTLESGAISTYSTLIRRHMEAVHVLRLDFAGRFNAAEDESCRRIPSRTDRLQIAFRKGRWQEVVARDPQPDDVRAFVHKIRQVLDGQAYDDELEITYLERKKGAADWKKVSISRLGPKRRSQIALRLLAGASLYEAPAFIDGPEGSFGNEVLVDFCSLRHSLDDQLIFFTQNPNVAVLANAEQLVILDVIGGLTKAVATGGLEHQDVTDGVIRLLEGGSTAFQRKLLRYQAELRRLGLKVRLQ